MNGRATLPTFLLSVLTLTGCSTATVTPAAAPTGDQLDWRDCTSEEITPRSPWPEYQPDPLPVPDGMQCADLDVPVDYRDADGRTVPLHVARLPQTGDTGDGGTVIFHPGGPGGSGVVDLVESEENLSGLREDFDLVSLTPRGVMGGWHDLFPTEECLLNGPRFASAATEEEFNAAVALNGQLLEDCRRHDPELFDNLDSATLARDVDTLRTALGEEEVNFFGESYGGVVGSSYARLFPERVRTMFLDSPLDHVRGFEEVERDLTQRTEIGFAGFADWCAREPECVWHGLDVEDQWQALVARADEEPIPAEGYDSEPYRGDVLKFVGAVYSTNPETWPTFSQALAMAQDGDASGLMAPFPGNVPFVGAASMATECADGVRFEGYADYAEAVEESRKLSPNFSGYRAVYDALCAAWPIPVANPRGPIDGDGMPPVLTAASTLEIAGARTIAGEIPGSVALEVEGRDHGLYGYLGNSCVIGHADRYFEDGTLPGPEAFCELD